MEKSIPIEDLKELALKLFETQNTWDIVKNGEVVAGYDALTKIEKTVALKIICQDKYTEDQIAYIRLTEDLTSGFALTVDAFCAGGEIKNALIKYADIKKVVFDDDIDMEDDEICRSFRYFLEINDEYKYESRDVLNSDESEIYHTKEDYLFGADFKIYKALSRFLNLVTKL